MNGEVRIRTLPFIRMVHTYESRLNYEHAACILYDSKLGKPRFWKLGNPKGIFEIWDQVG